MITDRIQLAGRDSYFQDPANPGRIDLGGIAPKIRTDPLNKGKQLEISGIQLLIDHDNLRTLMKFQSPLFKISVMKEMFVGLFADPYSHRVHNIAGFLDFNEGTLTNGRVMEIDGIPTIVSSNKDKCVWVSKEYEMPDPISIDAVAWELATSKPKLTPPDSFHYKIKITSKDENGAGLPSIDIDNGGMLKADAKRAIDSLNNANIKSFQITFTAKVFEDSYLTERHLPSINEKIGRPLLRAINILEPIQSIYEIHSIVELQNLCSDFHLFERSQAAIRQLTATLHLGATLVNSPNQKIVNNIYDDLSQFEYVELKLFANQFTRFEAKRLGFELRTNI
jgi:hypothetical protein